MMNGNGRQHVNACTATETQRVHNNNNNNTTTTASATYEEDDDGDGVVDNGDEQADLDRRVGGAEHHRAARPRERDVDRDRDGPAPRYGVDVLAVLEVAARLENVTATRTELVVTAPTHPACD